MTEPVRVESVEDDEEEMNLMETGGDGVRSAHCAFEMPHYDTVNSIRPMF